MVKGKVIFKTKGLFLKYTGISGVKKKKVCSPSNLSLMLVTAAFLKKSTELYQEFQKEWSRDVL